MNAVIYKTFLSLIVMLTCLFFLSVDCQNQAGLDSREGKDIINSVNNLSWVAGEIGRSYTIDKIFKVNRHFIMCMHWTHHCSIGNTMAQVK